MKKIIHYEDSEDKGYYFCRNAVGKNYAEKMTDDWDFVTCKNCLKKHHEKIFEPFNTVQTGKMHRVLRTLLNENQIPNPIENCMKKEFGVLDSGNVCMVVAKSKRARAVLWRYTCEGNWDKIPKLKYNGSLQSCKYSIEYLTKIVTFFHALRCKQTSDGQSLILAVKKEFPLTVETDDWKVILAPRVDID